MRGAGCPRVTQPFATLYTPEGALTVRLACVRRAASVHPEPGSNSPFKSSSAHRAPSFVFADVRARRRITLIRIHKIKVFRIDMVYIEIFACCLVVDLIDRSIRFSRFAAPARRRAGNNYTHSGARLARLSAPSTTPPQSAYPREAEAAWAASPTFYIFAGRRRVRRPCSQNRLLSLAH